MLYLRANAIARGENFACATAGAQVESRGVRPAAPGTGRAWLRLHHRPGRQRLTAPVMVEIKRDDVVFARVYDIRGRSISSLLAIPAP
jgi:hypothetical protein